MDILVKLTSNLQVDKHLPWVSSETMLVARCSILDKTKKNYPYYITAKSGTFDQHPFDNYLEF